MKFMNVIKKFGSQKDYVDYRNQMLDEAQTLLDEGKMEDYQAKVADVETLDNEYKEYAEAQANVNALKGAVSMQNVMKNTAKDGMVAAVGFDNTEDQDKAYRNAFMNYVLKGTEIPTELKNSDAYTTTSDVGAVIPNTILERIVEKIENYGNILAKVTRTFYKGGVTVPTSSAKPVATWTSERGTTDKQKKTLGSITFAYHKLRCVVAVGLTTDIVTLDVFEKTLANNIAEAMVKAMEAAIFNGTGASNNQPVGLLTETPVTGQTVEITEGNHITYADLCKMEAALPAGYETAEWALSKKTYFQEIVGMVDDNGQPVGRVNQGTDGKPVYSILGRPVNITAHMADFATTVTADTKVAVIFRWEDYMLNTNMDVMVKKYVDEDTDDQLTKAIMLVDGKTIDKNSLVELVVKNS